MFSKRAFAVLFAAICAGCQPDAVALDVDFDADLIQLQLYLGNSFTLRNTDGDANGLKEDDQLGMLGILLGGGTPAACIPSPRQIAIQDAYTFNYNEVANHVTVNISGVGTVNLITQLQSIDPSLSDALRRLLAGIITISDTQTIDYVNSIADQVVAQVLKGTPQENQTQAVQDQVTFLAEDFQPLGSAGDTNILGADGDIEEDSNSNLAEYLDLSVPSREAWLTSCCLVPTLRLVSYGGGGTKVTGIPLTFSVTAAGGAGPLTYTWFKGLPGSGTPVGSGSSYTIGFANTTDSGTYYATVNDGTYTRTTPKLTLAVVYVPLFVTQQISGGTRFEGTSKTFTVGVQGGQPGPYVYTWKKGDTILNSTTNSYTIPALTTGDSGQYSVSITSNEGGDTVTSGPVTLTVNTVDGLTIATQPQSATRDVGTSYTFSIVVVGGSGNYSYTWRKNGQPFGAPNQNTLAFPNISGGNAGVYSCVVQDLSDSTTVTSQNATLTVTGGLTMSTQPQGTTLDLDDDYTLSVAVTGGSGNYDYAWYKDGNLIDQPSSPTYAIVNATGDDTGDYTCYVTDIDNPTMSILSNIATVVVRLGGLSVTGQPEGGTFFVGENIQLQVAVSGGSGNYSYDWTLENTSLGAPDSPTLVLNGLTVDDTGNYRCRISDDNQPGVSIISDNALVTVIDASPLTIEQQPQAGFVYTGEPVTIGLQVFGGSGSYTFEWTRNGDPVCGCDAESFTINAVSFEDAGTYQCVITDTIYPTLQVTSDPAVLQVGADMQITQQPVGGSFIAGQSYALQTVVTGGIGVLFYEWEHDGQVVPNAPNEPTLDLNVVRMDEAGEYVCVITDRFRQIRTEPVTIEVALTPVPEGKLDFNFSLNGQNAVPPADTVATGNAVGSVTRNGGNPALGATLAYSTVQTVGDAQVLAIFAGAVGVKGEIMVSLGPALVVLSGSVQLTEEETSILYGGYGYLGVTSTLYPDGEIRGQFALSYTPPPSSHTTDQDNDGVISLDELLRIIQFYNSLEYHCDIDGEDGYAPGPGNRECGQHDSDYAPADWSISLDELLRMIQFYNSLAYYACDDPESEDGFCPGPDPGK